MESQQQLKKQEGFTTEPYESRQKDKKDNDQIKPVSFFRLFRFANKFDVILMIFGSIAAMALGTAMPAFAFIWGKAIQSFFDPNNMVQQSYKQMLLFIYIGIGAFFAGLIMFGCWMVTGERQGIACRRAYLRSLLKQQIGWFDLINQTQLSSKFAADTFAYQGALGQKISTIIMAISMLVAGFIFAFITGWLMSLVMLATIPALGIAGFFYMKVIGEKDKKSKEKYHKAGGKAEQAISAIKTVKQLNGEQYEGEQYSQCLQKAQQNSNKYGFYSGLGIGSIFFVMLASYSLGFWFGSKCVIGTQNCPESIIGETYDAGDVLIVFFSVIIAGFNLSQLSPALKKITEGRYAAARIFQVIDREPKIVNPPNGVKIQNLRGVFKFENVTFSYPKDPTHKILNNLSLEFDSNNNGLVGVSGCGKSTVLQLLMRFYDPDEGVITLDGHDLRTLDLIWLRQQFGYVGQEPVLFATSIKDNLLFGSQNATDQQIKSALDRSEANFVYDLEKGLQTYVGYGGGQLSGGQKQRIAIARAILRNPKILLLDEATSALDRRNQRLIQKTLDSLSSGRTTITVAHRMKTIMNSDMIFVFEKGGIKEKGKFNELQLYKGHSIQEQEELQEKKEQKEKNQKPAGNKGFLSFGMDEQDNNPFKTDEEIEKERLKALNEKYDKQLFGRVFRYSKDKICFFIAGIFVALLNGTVFPVFSIFLAFMLDALLIVDVNPNDQQAIDNINLYALLFLIFGIAALIFTTIQIWFFSIVGQSITMKIRVEAYQKILKMPIPWFDVPNNNAGTLTARLSVDAQQVNSLTTTIISIMIQNISTLITGIVIAFAFEWRTALVALGLLPLMIICGVIQMQFQTGFSDETDQAYKDSSNLIMESMVNIRTVSSFGYEGVITNRYNKKMELPYKLAVKKGILSGFFFGLSQIIMFIIFGLLFYLGAIFVRDNEDATVKGMFTAIFAITFAGMTAGNNAHFMPDAASAKNSAANIFQILDSQDEPQMQEKQGSKRLKSGFEGTIELRHVDFKYQSRNEYVFKNMNIQIHMGEKAAFVGPSGCGKSTIIQLLQRFYYPENGKILINNIDIKDFDLHYLRSQFGVVSQEPSLFNGSFKQNIVYNKKNVSDSQLVEAARKANALSFIEGSEKIVQTSNNEEKGFDKNVGVKGSHISGGQKQRVAIARSIIRDPNILLLDEATSALDQENEKIVQNSLDSIMAGKTTITIAHRIQTIKNSDAIYVFEKGQIVESGNYSELVKKKGYFYNLERGTQFV